MTNIGAMSAGARGEELLEQEIICEYLVHGEFKASRPKRRLAAAYWVPLRTMMRHVGRESVEVEIDLFIGRAEKACKAEMSDSEEDDESDESDDAAGGGD